MKNRGCGLKYSTGAFNAKLTLCLVLKIFVNIFVVCDSVITKITKNLYYKNLELYSMCTYTKFTLNNYSYSGLCSCS